MFIIDFVSRKFSQFPYIHGLSMLHLKKYRYTLAVVRLILTFLLFFYEMAAQEFSAQTSPFLKCWEYNTKNINLPDIASDNVSIYIPFSNGRIESINPKTKKKNWETDLGGEIIQPPLPDDSSILILTRKSANVFLTSLGKTLGVTDWQTGFDFNDEAYILNNKDILFVGSKGGKLFAVKKESGHIIWRRNLGFEITAEPLIFENKIVIGSKSRRIIFYSIDGGEISYEMVIPYPPNIISIVKNKYLFWGDNKGNIYLSDLLTKKIVWKIRSGAEISHVNDTPQGILIASLDNFLYLVSLDKGRIIWKKRFDGRLLFSSIIKGGYVLSAAFGSQSAAVIDIDNGRIVDQFFIEDGNYFTDAPRVLDDLLVFPTVKGIIAFSNSATVCV